MQNIGKFLSWDLPCIVFNSQKITIMLNKKTNEELQSRREFFKQAAKAALPVVGAMIMASVPFVETPAMTGCSGDCAGTCKGTCQSGCKNTCYNDCYNACKNTCDYTCRGTCSGSCKGTGSK